MKGHFYMWIIKSRDVQISNYTKATGYRAAYSGILHLLELWIVFNRRKFSKQVQGTQRKKNRVSWKCHYFFPAMPDIHPPILWSSVSHLSGVLLWSYSAEVWYFTLRNSFFFTFWPNSLVWLYSPSFANFFLLIVRRLHHFALNQTTAKFTNGIHTVGS